MKTLIISDTHLTNKFDKRKYEFLAKIIDSADQVIIDGDFWDSWYTSFDNFLASKWSDLFALLLKKNTVYIYGNHDPKEKSDDRIALFSVKNTETYVFKSGNQVFKVVHGDKLLENLHPPFLENYGKVLNKIENSVLGVFVRHLLHSFEWTSFHLLGPVRVTNSTILRNNNGLLKHQNTKSGHWLICGNTHCAEVDRALLFANSGSIDYGMGSYLIIENGLVHEFKESY